MVGGHRSRDPVLTPDWLQGSCLASPRWVSLLVAEIYYPDTFFPTPEQPIQGVGKNVSG